jgi:hypothetical protein
MWYEVGTDPRRLRMTRPASLVLLFSYALGLSGCNGAFWGNVVVLGVTVGIFFGTLSLGRDRRPQEGSASSSKS